MHVNHSWIHSRPLPLPFHHEILSLELYDRSQSGEKTFISPGAPVLLLICQPQTDGGSVGETIRCCGRGGSSSGRSSPRRTLPSSLLEVQLHI